MTTTFTISEATQALLNILKDLHEIDEKVFTWLQTEWGEDTPQFNKLNETRFNVNKAYEEFIISQLGDRICEQMREIKNTTI